MQTQTFNIALPQDLVKKVDTQAKKEYRNRSELIREALRVYLARNQAWEQIFQAGKEAANKAGVKTEEDVIKIVRQYRRGQ